MRRSITKDLGRFFKGLSVENYFLGGIAVGLAFGGVALVTISAAQRAMKRRLAAKSLDDKMPVIDGVRPINKAILDARPAPEASSSEVHLASEAVDVPPLSQRW